MMCKMISQFEFAPVTGASKVEILCQVLLPVPPLGPRVHIGEGEAGQAGGVGPRSECQPRALKLHRRARLAAVINQAEQRVRVQL